MNSSGAYICTDHETVATRGRRGGQSVAFLALLPEPGRLGSQRPACSRYREQLLPCARRIDAVCRFPRRRLADWQRGDRSRMQRTDQSALLPQRDALEACLGGSHSTTARDQVIPTLGQFLVKGHALCCLKVHQHKIAPAGDCYDPLDGIYSERKLYDLAKHLLYVANE